MKVTNALWYYFFSKAIEFMDTILMVIRKRFTQITFLHVFHHSTMLIIWWIVMTWIPVSRHAESSSLDIGEQHECFSSRVDKLGSVPY